MDRNQLADADLADLPRTASCLSASELSLPASRRWPLSAKPTVVSRRLLSRCPRLGRQSQKSLSFLSRRHQNQQRSESIPRERSLMEHLWILLFLQRKVVRFRNSVKRNMSSLHRSRSASHHGHRLPTTLRSLLIRKKTWPSLLTTTLFSSLML
jgi:hypothetical protein